MKKIIFSFICILILTSCGVNKQEENKQGSDSINITTTIVPLASIAQFI
jgi:ABC-type Zn uptake system ZnuABC Zn-binding protein ZnuA